MTGPRFNFRTLTFVLMLASFTAFVVAGQKPQSSQKACRPTVVHTDLDYDPLRDVCESDNYIDCTPGNSSACQVVTVEWLQVYDSTSHQMVTVFIHCIPRSYACSSRMVLQIDENMATYPPGHYQWAVGVYEGNSCSSLGTRLSYAFTEFTLD